MHNDKYQSKMEKELVYIFSKYDKSKINGKILKNLYESHISAITKSTLSNLKEPFPLIQFHISQNGVHVDDYVLQQFRRKTDMRVINIIKMLKRTLQWAKDNNLPIPSTIMHLWISDRFPWYDYEPEKFPMFVFGRPSGINFPILPDATFECLELEKKYKGKCYDWENLKKIIKKECRNVSKEKVIYFKGVPTGQYTTNFRSKFQELSKELDIPIKILLNAWDNYEPVYKWCKYMYLLNLPGHYPWSSRLKYLMLMDSVVININLQLANLEPEYKDEPYVTFIDYVLDKNDYIDYVFTFHRVSRANREKYKDKIQKMNDEEFEKLSNELRAMYKDLITNPSKYSAMVKRAKQKVDRLTHDRISQYVYKAIVKNSEFIGDQPLWTPPKA